MWKSKPPYRLILNKAASDEIMWHCKHYTGRGVMKFYNTGEELCKDMGVALSTLEATHQQHFEAAKKQERLLRSWLVGFGWHMLGFVSTCLAVTGAQAILASHTCAK